MNQRRRDKVTGAIKHQVERPDFGLRVIIVFKLIKAALLVLVAVGAFSLIHSDLHAVGVHVAGWFRIAPANETLERVLAKLTGLSTARLAEIGAGALVYSAVLLVEAWGLHRRRTWAEWLTIIL